MSLWRDTIIRNAEGRERTENSLEVKLQEFCGRHKRNIEQYTITDDGLVGCLSCFIWDDDLVEGKLPFKFGKVEDKFDCSCCKLITSLEGCPKEVGGDFICTGCIKLTTLEGCPKETGGDFVCLVCATQFTEEEVRQRCKVAEEIYV